MKKRLLMIIASIVLLIAVSGCNTVKEMRIKDEQPTMFGMIYDWGNNPVSGVSVYVNGAFTATSDFQGRFVLAINKNDEYAIRLEKKGYETIDGFFISEPLSILYYRMINADELIGEAEKHIESFEYDSALRCVDRALALEEFRYDAAYLKGVIYFKQNKFDEALAALELSRQLGYTGVYASRLQKVIEEKKNETR